MEDLEMKQTLRRYVEASEPPFSLTANVLISQARRRQRWRLGLGIGGGGAATTLAIVSTMALVPVAGGGPTFGPGCDVQLPLSSATPIMVLSAYPAPQPAPHSALPTLDATGSAIPGQDAPPSAAITPKLAPPPSTGLPLPGGAPALPENTAQPEPGGAGQERLDEMSCFLKRRLVQLRPDASIAGHVTAPLEVVREKGIGPDNKPSSVYRASAYIVDGPLLCLINIMVFRGELPLTPGLSHADHLATATVKTRSSTILVVVEGAAITDQQALEIANAPELDLYR